MADQPRHVATGTKRRLIGLVVLGGLACAAPALAADPPPSTDSQLRALSGSDTIQESDPCGRMGSTPPI